MKSNRLNLGVLLAAFPLSALSLAISSVVYAQGDGSTYNGPVNPMEEMVVLGRVRSAATDTIVQRMEMDVAVDIINEEQISRIGDTNVADALQRLPGVTTVDDKFVYVRGLGERYLSSTLNGAMVPSPDLTRNVIPLDIFPTSIVESLSVQKAYSADMSANFGGGSVDITTKGIPNAPTFEIEVGVGSTSNAGDFLSYNGGDDDVWGKDDGTRSMSPVIDNALDLYLGDFSEDSILKNDPGVSTREEAAQVQRELTTELYRDLTIQEESGSPDYGVKVNGGTLHTFVNGMEIGFLAGASYINKWRNESQEIRNVADPENQARFKSSSTNSVDITGNLSFGFLFNEDNSIETTSLYIRNTDDETAIENIFNENRLISDGIGFRDYTYEYEQRELIVNQIHGKHVLTEETRDSLNLGFLSFLDGLSADWYYSDAEVSTKKPSEVTFEADTVADKVSGEVLSSTIQVKPNVGNYRYTDLVDYVDSTGVEFGLPFETDSLVMSVKGGWEYWKKARVYEQIEFSMGMDNVDRDALPLEQGPTEVFSDDNVLNPDFDFSIISRNTNSNSYIAANKLNAYFGEFDVTWNDFVRVTLGGRWEDFKLATLDWNPLAYGSSSQISYPDDIGTRSEEDTFYTAATTLMFSDFWAEDFQLRFNLAETAVRPDLREVSPSSFEDPLTDLLVFGNPDVLSSSIKHYDIRAEWFFGNGNNFTWSAFHKDVTDPIELFSLPISDGGLAAEVENGERGSITGSEIEGLISLGNVLDVLDPFFLQGNITVLESELEVGDKANAPTNLKREMNGASPYSVNFIVGFDSADSMHAATLSYNVFGERLFIAGRNGATDIYESPFHSLNFTYSFYPIEALTIKLKMKNLLDQSTTYTREDYTGADMDIIDIDKGQEYSLSFQYKY
ncbi:Outer membrane receptor proteins, mostly Fe transport [Alteromonadaceae bacterium Bs31]|nr:Outer membrane receptor proteins, mostly Fe transport [Alteromonadaceae bacterium Bs31]